MVERQAVEGESPIDPDPRAAARKMRAQEEPFQREGKPVEDSTQAEKEAQQGKHAAEDEGGRAP